MKTHEEIKAIEDRISELERNKRELDIDLEEYKNRIKQTKKSISIEISKLKRKIDSYKYYRSNYDLKDYSTSPAFQLFGKRAKDLTPEEKKEYQRIMTQKSRQSRKKK